MSDTSIKEKVVGAIKAIKNGPRAGRMYMEMCAKCGTCASVCPVYYGDSDKRYNPVERTDLIRMRSPVRAHSHEAWSPETNEKHAREELFETEQYLDVIIR